MRDVCLSLFATQKKKALARSLAPPLDRKELQTPVAFEQQKSLAPDRFSFKMDRFVVRRVRFGVHSDQQRGERGERAWIATTFFPLLSISLSSLSTAFFLLSRTR